MAADNPRVISTRVFEEMALLFCFGLEFKEAKLGAARRVTLTFLDPDGIGSAVMRDHRERVGATVNSRQLFDGLRRAKDKVFETRDAAPAAASK